MIIPMTKYSFLIYHSEYDSFLEKLQDMGVVDVIVSKKSLEDQEKEKLKSIQKVQLLSKKLAKRINEENTDKSSIVLKGEELVNYVEDLYKKIDLHRANLNSIIKNIERILPWGNFTPETIKKIEENNYKLRFFICSEKKFDSSLLGEIPHQVISDSQNFIYFIVVQKSDENFDIKFADEIQVPMFSINELNSEIEVINSQIAKLEQELDLIAVNHIADIEDFIHKLQNEFDVERIVSNKQTHVDDKVILLEGWVPRTIISETENELDNSGVLYVTNSPESGDKVPILLKNNKFARLFEPIGKLFSLPSYNEMDLTQFFSPFFMMFFGFCLGDLGYGIVLVLIATILKSRMKKDMKPMMSLIQLLGIGTIIFGVVSGTLFGINLIEADIPAIANIKDKFLDPDAMFNLALILGLTQMIFGMILRAVNQFRQNGIAYSMPSIGWILLILSLLDFGLLKMTDGKSIYVTFLAIGLIVWFSDPKGSVFSRLGKGIWELYGITGIFGDVLSYIRLFALGISSAILGFVINDIALQVKTGIPYAGPVLFVVFLIIGHTGNLLIASLGAFVHPMRLTFVEFYKNAGFEGGGKEYRPLSKKKLNK